MSTKHADPRVARRKAGLTLLAVAAAARIDISTIVRAEKAGRWPAQRRTREALQRALGLAVEAGS